MSEYTIWVDGPDGAEKKTIEAYHTEFSDELVIFKNGNAAGSKVNYVVPVERLIDAERELDDKD